ncbi:hypothetical protein MuYL_2097 [Mucilaginibacter xinganensis]|uniref:Uncharacterized protein n=1 Tax=Mucilaginibacter xinganensis TaxID=1234841 RepID=A0A223NVS0_9SPHI|nr:hypothetical protein MuYL_2097 [Mucilaginibacter xinganensis]
MPLFRIANLKQTKVLKLDFGKPARKYITALILNTATWFYFEVNDA